MDANTNSDLAQDSEVVDDEPTVPVSFPDDTHDVSRKASVLDPEKRRRLEEEDEEDDKNSDRHRRKKKKSKDRDREHKDKDKDKDKDRDRDGKKRDHKDRDKDRDRERDRERDRGSGRDRSERDRDRDRDHEADRLKRKTKGDDVERPEDDASRKRADSADLAPNGKDKDKDRASSSSAKTSNGDSLTEVDPADKSAKREGHRDTEKESKRSDRASEKDKDRDRESKDRDGKEKEKERRSRRSRSRSPARRETDERDRRDRDRDRSRERRARERERERERDRARDRDRDRERDDRNRDRGGSYRRRERSRSRSAEKRRADRDKEREERAEKEKKDKADGVKRITLKDILTANPGISMPDAVQRLNVYNTAAAMSAGPLDPSVASTALSGPSNGGSGGMEMYYGGHPVDPNTAAMAAAQAVAALNAQVVGAGGPFGVIGAGGAITKPHREVYIGNLPPGVTVSQLADFLNVALKQLGVAKEGGSVVSCWVSGDGHYGFAELRTVEECNAALAYLNGVQIGINLIKVGRPKGYSGPTGVPPMLPGFVPPAGLLGGMMNPLTGMMGLPQPPNPMMANMGGLGMGGLGMGMGMGMVGGMPVVSHANVVMVSNLPMGIKDDEVRELVSPFGTLTAFNSIKTSSGTSQAAVFEYEDSAAADSAVSGLDKLEIGEHKLSVQRVPPHAAPLLLQPSINPTPPARPPPPAAKDRLQDLPPTCVIRLSNMTTPQELASDDECMELQEDVAEECNVYGVVRSVVIPRGNGDDGEPRGEEVGMVYVHFTHSEGAAKAKGAIAGRMFNGNIVKATFFPEELFLQQIYLLPENYKIPTDEVEGDVVGDAEGDVVVPNGDSEYVCEEGSGNVADVNASLALPSPAVVMPIDDAMD